MHGSDLRAILERAEHLLWVMARCDVEDLPTHRSDVLRRLAELEHRAAQLGVPDLYRKVLQASPALTKIVL
ncbi:MAG TPA: hypothetical protein VKT49_23660 [Bryobacteraceae bacterium]|nr:hypothetical protein [Bryobacteraceae bacterium]